MKPNRKDDEIGNGIDTDGENDILRHRKMSSSSSVSLSSCSNPQYQNLLFVLLGQNSCFPSREYSIGCCPAILPRSTAIGKRQDVSHNSSKNFCSADSFCCLPKKIISNDYRKARHISSLVLLRSAYGQSSLFTNLFSNLSQQ